jgi:hypothetical protein
VAVVQLLGKLLCDLDLLKVGCGWGWCTGKWCGVAVAVFQLLGKLLCDLHSLKVARAVNRVVLLWLCMSCWPTRRMTAATQSEEQREKPVQLPLILRVPSYACLLFV